MNCDRISIGLEHGNEEFRKKILKKNFTNKQVIEDVAHARGSSYEEKKIGSFGLACISFHAVKNLPVGDEKMVITMMRKNMKCLKDYNGLGLIKKLIAEHIKMIKN